MPGPHHPGRAPGTSAHHPITRQWLEVPGTGKARPATGAVRRPPGSPPPAHRWSSSHSGLHIQARHRRLVHAVPERPAATRLQLVLHARSTPRRRGGNRRPYSGLGWTRGTPPHRRGGRLVRGVGLGGRRLTPASAGRTFPCPTPARLTPAHPRVGGEGASQSQTRSPPSDTPPRRRGGLRGAGSSGRCGRHTPASAGRQAQLGEQLTAVRLTPASAGRTEAVEGEGLALATHPRVGGEDSEIATVRDILGGTPPRRQVGRRHQGLGFGERRHTPASAGRTRPRRCPRA